MRRWFITLALLANALLGGLVLVLLLNGGGWGEAARLSATEVQVLVVVAAVALVGTLLLVPVLGISFWLRDRRFRRQATELTTWRQEAPSDEPQPQGGSPTRPPRADEAGVPADAPVDARSRRRGRRSLGGNAGGPDDLDN